MTDETQARAEDTRQHGRRRAFTLIELLVVLGIIAVLLAILIPAALAVRERSRSAGCMSNLRAIGHAIVMYANDNKDRMVPADLRDPAFVHQPGNWATILVYGKYLSVPDEAASSGRNSVLRCPSGIDEDGFDIDAYYAPRDSNLQAAYWKRQAGVLGKDGSWTPGIVVLTWYGINAEYQDGELYPTFRVPSETGRTALHLFSQLRQPSSLALVYDGFFHHDREANLMGHARHIRGTTTNYLFADGHVSAVATASLPASFDDADLEKTPYPRFRR